MCSSKVSCQESPNDADTLFVEITVDALNYSDNVPIVEQDVDIHVIITGLSPLDKNIYL